MGVKYAEVEKGGGAVSGERGEVMVFGSCSWVGAFCYNGSAMRESTRFLVRKVLLTALLGVAGLGAAVVFQRLTREKTEDVLLQLGAEHVLTQSVVVNGRPLVAEVWSVPETSSTVPLQKSAGKALIVGKTVYLFKADALGKARGDVAYPAAFPVCEMACDYVMEAGLMQCVTGRTRRSREEVLVGLVQSAGAAGWVPRGAQVWERGAQMLIVQASEGKDETHVALMIAPKPER